MSEQEIENSLREELEQLREKNVLEQFLDLSLREILVLFFIMRYPGEIVRNSLREDVNSYLNRDFSPSSFYNILDKLEKKKLIEIDKKEGTIVNVTSKAREIIVELNRLTLICQIDFVKIIQQMVPQVLEKSGPREFKNTLLINLEFKTDVVIINQLSEVTQNLFILASTVEIKNYRARGLKEKIHQSNLIGNKIREANDFFDSVVVIGFKGLSKYSEKIVDLLKNEIPRVLQKNGILYLTSSKHPALQEEHFISILIENLFKGSEFLSSINKESLFDDLKSMQFKDLDYFYLNGMIIGWGIKE